MSHGKSSQMRKNGTTSCVSISARNASELFLSSAKVIRISSKDGEGCSVELKLIPNTELIFRILRSIPSEALKHGTGG